MAKARKKSTRKKSSSAGKCKRVVVGGKARIMCWGANGKIKSNKAAGAKRKTRKRARR